MIRHVLSLLLSIAVLGAAGQSATAMAECPMQPGHVMMSSADCMQMMQSMQEKGADTVRHVGKHTGCTPVDCLNHMIACCGMALAVPDAITYGHVLYARDMVLTMGPSTPLRGRSPPPDIQPPNA
jgi:hypothetical protein